MEEVGGGLQGPHPVPVDQEGVDLVGEDELLHVDVPLPEGSTRVTVSTKRTFRSSSPWIRSTGERQRSIWDMGEDSKARRVRSGSSRGLKSGRKVAIPTFQSWTPWMSTPAAQRSEARASPWAVR
jgi:hypothetical protein